MRLFALSRLPLRLLTLPFLALLLAFPASGPARAQTDTPPESVQTESGQADPNSADTPHGTNPESMQTENAPPDGVQADPDAAMPPDEDSDSATADPNADSAETGQDPATTEPASKVLITIDKAAQQMTVWVDGVEQYTWPVSTGKPGYSTPSGTYAASSMNEVWYSKQWDSAPMPHSIFFTKKGHAIHGSYDVKMLGTAASHGCVRLAPKNASILFALVKEKGLKNTEVVLSGETPGGETVVASPGARQPPWGQAAPWFYPGYEYYGQRPRRYTWRNNRWRQPYYNGPQGYYQAPRYYQPPRYRQQPRGIYPFGY